MNKHTEPHDLEIDTSGSPDMTYPTETDADSVLWGVDSTTYRMKRLPSGRVGIWYRKPVDRFARCVVLINYDGDCDDGCLFPTRTEAAAYAIEHGYTRFEIRDNS